MEISQLTCELGIEPAIEGLLKKLDGLPLALATAGAYLGLTSMSVSEYLHYHETSWIELQQQAPKLLSYKDQTLYSTWNLSYMHIRKEDEAAAKLLELWAYFDHQDLWFDLLEAGNTDEAPSWFLDITRTELTFKGVMAKLQKHALIESLTGSDGYSMHYCVYSWVKAVLRIAIERPMLELAFDCIGENITVVPAPGDWRVKQRLLPHAERGLQLLHSWREDEKNSNDLEIYVTRFLMNLGILYRDQGKLKEAESMYQRALAGKEKALGPDHTSTLETVNNLGILYRNQSKLGEAESMYQRALAGYSKKTGSNSRGRANTFYNMGLLSRESRNFERALEYFKQAHESYSTLFGPQNAETIDALNQVNKTMEEQKAAADPG